jgi:hypothetical protein
MIHADFLQKAAYVNPNCCAREKPRQPLLSRSISVEREQMTIIDPDAYSIPEFCRRNGISPSFYFLLQQQGRGPRVMHVNARRLISKEAAADWRREREVKAQEVAPSLKAAASAEAPV